jgi:release factor glutamine methyltransferase
LTNQNAFNFLIEQLVPYYLLTEAKAMAEVVFEDVFGLSKSKILLVLNHEFRGDEKLNEIIERLIAHEPLQHIIGYTFFCGLKIDVNPHVLIPRPETEELVEWIIQDTQKEPKLVVDICTGSGCIALALKNHFKNTHFVATDISDDALETARINETQVFNSSEITFIRHNCLEDKWPLEIPNIIVSNPPYIAPSESQSMDKNVLAFEPHLALFAPEEDVLVFYKSIIQIFKNTTMPIIYFELNPLSANDLTLYCENEGLSIQLKKDMVGKLRFAKVNRA